MAWSVGSRTPLIPTRMTALSAIPGPPVLGLAPGWE